MALRVVPNRLDTALPSDLILLGYVSVTGLLLAAFGHKLGPTLWLGLTAAHLAILALTLWAAGLPLRRTSLSGFLREAYPFFCVIFLYWELRHLARLFSNGYHDGVILRLEEWVFGEQLALTLSQRFPYLALSETLHFFYGFYWALLPLAGVLLYVRGRKAGFRELLYVELSVFFVCYLVFIFFPVAGPHYEFAAIGGQLAEGPFYRLVHWVLEDGGSKGAAFPSSHVAVAVTISLITWRHDRLVWWVTLPFVVGLTVSTVYGRFHYGIDAVSGILVAVWMVPLARWLGGRLWRTGGAQPGNGVAGSPV